MNTAMLMGNWTEIKGKIKTQWAKLNDHDIDEFKGNLDQLSGKIQQIYGYKKEQAEHEFNEFKKSIASSLNTTASAIIDKVDSVMSNASEAKGASEAKDADAPNVIQAKPQVKNSVGTLGAILIAGLMASCTHGPVVQDYPDTANPAVEVESLGTELTSARANQVDVLSPHHFQEAAHAYNSAKSSLEKQKNAQDVLHQVAEGKAYLVIANQFAETAHANIEDVILARQSAVSAGGIRFFETDFTKIDHRLTEVTSEIEKNDLKDAAKVRTELQMAYLDLELRSIKETHLAQSRATIVKAEKEGAKDFAPRTLAIAQKSVLDTDAFITANRHDSESITGRAQATRNASDHLLKITRNAKAGKVTSAEDSALALESEQNKVGAKQKELNTTKVQLNQNRAQLSDQQDQTRALTAENTDLTADQAFNQQFEHARAQFTLSEAEVYKQGSNLMIRLRGLEFPTSQAVIKGSNFPLLAKVQKVINEFGANSVIVEGHTDSLGGKKVNEKLSSDRADAVKKYFISNAGSEALNITSVGYDYQKPLATNKTSNGRAQNRRVDVLIEAKMPAKI